MFKLKVKYLDDDKLTLSSDFNNKKYENEVVNFDFRDIKIDECTFKKIDFENSTFSDIELIKFSRNVNIFGKVSSRAFPMTSIPFIRESIRLIT